MTKDNPLAGKEVRIYSEPESSAPSILSTDGKTERSLIYGELFYLKDEADSYIKSLQAEIERLKNITKEKIESMFQAELKVRMDEHKAHEKDTADRLIERIGIVKIDAEEMLFKIKPTLDLLEQLSQKDDEILFLAKEKKRWKDIYDGMCVELEQKDAELKQKYVEERMYITALAERDRQISTLQSLLDEVRDQHQNCKQKHHDVVIKLKAELEKANNDYREKLGEMYSEEQVKELKQELEQANEYELHCRECPHYYEVIDLEKEQVSKPTGFGTSSKVSEVSK